MARLSRTFLPTFKAESLSSSQAALPSLSLLLRGGFVRQSSAGVFTLLPMGLRIVEKICSIINDEMKQIGASKLELPTLLTSALWKQTRRWETMGSEVSDLPARHATRATEIISSCSV